MPEGHSVHRIARQFDRNIVGRAVAASSPQGRFVEGAAVLDGREALEVRAVGKQMFLRFDPDVWLRVHLGMYGAWDFSGEVAIDATIASANGRMGHTNQRGTVLDEPIMDAAGENSLTSIGAPRRARVRMSEQTTGLEEQTEWPPPVVGAVRLRLLTETTCADLRGPTACALQTPDEVAATIAKLGPDPLVDDVAEGRSGSSPRCGESRRPSGCCSWTSRWSAGSATSIAPRSSSVPGRTRTRRAATSARRPRARCGATGSGFWRSASRPVR